MAVNHTSVGVRLIGAYFVLSALAFGSVGLGATDQGLGQFALVVGVAMVVVGFGLLAGRDWGLTGGILGSFLAFVVNAMLFMDGRSIGMGGALVSLLVVGYLVKEKGPSSRSWAPTGPRGP
ncbi:hypothetical protein [Haloarchaeobius iranensis]|uniref:Uncharacterized protein n=1 Tax=Haloarchaeobius iranensis TaxID=996166 RepID=A0A1G9W570_9EURY|nr:hypothetical protein [Haloarchaeobius iranensis]SDM79649.1 hypothetical protein SAMN05192554_107161 [Haloarchaeobius iranensis]